jgi:hypothetical protein
LLGDNLAQPGAFDDVMVIGGFDDTAAFVGRLSRSAAKHFAKPAEAFWLKPGNHLTQWATLNQKTATASLRISNLGEQHPKEDGESDGTITKH